MAYILGVATSEYTMLVFMSFIVRKDILSLQTQTLYSSQGTPCEPIPTGKILFSLGAIHKGRLL